MCCVVLMMMTGTWGGGGGWGSLVKQENTSQGDCAFRENTVTGEGEGRLAVRARLSVEALGGPRGGGLCCVSFIRAIPATSLICRSPAATGRPMPRTGLTHRMCVFPPNGVQGSAECSLGRAQPGLDCATTSCFHLLFYCVEDRDIRVQKQSVLQ